MFSSIWIGCPSSWISLQNPERARRWTNYLCLWCSPSDTIRHYLPFDVYFFSSFFHKLEVDYCGYLSFILSSLLPPQHWESWLRENLPAFRETWLWITSSRWPRPWTFWAASPLSLSLVQMHIKTCLYMALFRGRRKALLPYDPVTVPVTWVPFPTPNPHDRAHLWPGTSSRKTHCKTGKGTPSPSGNSCHFMNENYLSKGFSVKSMQCMNLSSLFSLLPSGVAPCICEASALPLNCIPNSSEQFNVSQALPAP